MFVVRLSIVLPSWLTVIRKIADFSWSFLRAPSRCALQLRMSLSTHGNPSRTPSPTSRCHHRRTSNRSRCWQRSTRTCSRILKPWPPIRMGTCRSCATRKPHGKSLMPSFTIKISITRLLIRSSGNPKPRRGILSKTCSPASSSSFAMKRNPSTPESPDRIVPRLLRSH